MSSRPCRDYTFGVSQLSALSRTELDKVQARVVPLLDKMQVDVYKRQLSILKNFAGIGEA